MRFSLIFSLLLATQLLAGCETFRRINSGQSAPEISDTPVPLDAESVDEQCPVVESVVCAEPEVKVVERVIERTYEKVVEVPVDKDKLVLGTVEFFMVEPGSLRLRSLIDSGAATSSLSVQELTPFERDGSEWVRFNLSTKSDAKPVSVELPVKRYVRVSRPGFERQRRAVVDMSLTVGDVTHMVEVNLTERSDFEFPLWVGRNFLKDAAVVDVSRKHVQGEPQMATFSK